MFLHVGDMPFDVILDELKAFLRTLSGLNFVNHKATLLVHCFVDADDFMGFVRFAEDAINAKYLQIFLAESL